MALPIKPTPHLTGKAARKFIKDVLDNENKPVPREDYERAKKVYEEMKRRHGDIL